MKRLLIMFVGLCIHASIYAADNTCYIPNGALKEKLREKIEYTQRCIDLCIRDFAALGIDEYLEVAKNRGIRVRVVIMGYDNARGLLAERLIHKGFDARVLRTQYGTGHLQDFIVFDDRTLVTGVYNWLAYHDRNICSDVIFYHSPRKINAYKNTFYKLFTEGEITPLLDNKKGLVTAEMPSVSGTISNTKTASQITQKYTTDDKKPITMGESARSATETLKKDFIDISVEDIDKQFGKDSTLTRSEKNKLWKEYKGKYVRWEGIVSYKGIGRMDWNRVGLSRLNGQDTEVEILFDWTRFEKVMNIRVGSVITYTGKLVSRRGINAPYRLEDGDIE